MTLVTLRATSRALLLAEACLHLSACSGAPASANDSYITRCSAARSAIRDFCEGDERAFIRFLSEGIVCLEAIGGDYPCGPDASTMWQVVREAPGCATPASETACLFIYGSHMADRPWVRGPELERYDAQMAAYCDCGAPLADIYEQRLREAGL